MSTIRSLKKKMLKFKGTPDRQLNDEQKHLAVITDVTEKKKREKPPKTRRWKNPLWGKVNK